MEIAKRIERLGTETAFAVSAQAAAFAAEGNTVYPFHLGDMNLKTPGNIIEAAHRAMLDGKTGYCPNAGIPALREAYFDIRYQGESRSFVSIPGMAERSVVLYTFSKKFAMTGWRLTAAIGPKEIIDVIAKLKRQRRILLQPFCAMGRPRGGYRRSERAGTGLHPA